MFFSDLICSDVMLLQFQLNSCTSTFPCKLVDVDIYLVRRKSSDPHLLKTVCSVDGAYLFGSSRTQRVVSLSSCEAELHAMTSTLSDGVFIKRCIEFVCGGQVDSPSGRQLAMRQGTGKIKHLSGKIRWIQDAVRGGDVQLIQVPTVWNLSDIGAKSTWSSASTSSFA